MPGGPEFSERHELTIRDPERSALPITTPGIIDVLESYCRKIGYAFSIADPDGDIFIQRHKANPRQGITDGEWSIPSETVKGHFENGIVTRIESFEECMRRMFIEEQGFDINDAPPEAHLFVTQYLPIFPIRWSMSHDTDRTIPNNTYGLSLSLHANEAMAQFMRENARETKEAYPGLFQPIHVLKGLVKARRMRAGFDAWLDEYEAWAKSSATFGLEHYLVLPRVPLATGDNWRSLRVGPKRQGKAIQLLICDGDGTLVDSDEQVIDATHATVRELGEHTTREQIMEYYAEGKGASNMFRKAAPHHDLETVVDRFYYHDERLGYDKVALMPGVTEALESLHKKMDIAICTERALPSTLRMLGHVGLLNKERFGIDADNIAALPAFTNKADGIRHLLKKFGAPPQRTVMYGNHKIDISAGRATGVHTIGITTSSGSHRQLLHARATELVPTMRSLPATLILLEDLM